MQPFSKAGYSSHFPMLSTFCGFRNHPKWSLVGKNTFVWSGIICIHLFGVAAVTMNIDEQKTSRAQNFKSWRQTAVLKKDSIIFTIIYRHWNETVLASGRHSSNSLKMSWCKKNKNKLDDWNDAFNDVIILNNAIKRKFSYRNQGSCQASQTCLAKQKFSSSLN